MSGRGSGKANFQAVDIACFSSLFNQMITFYEKLHKNVKLSHMDCREEVIKCNALKGENPSHFRGWGGIKIF